MMNVRFTEGSLALALLIPNVLTAQVYSLPTSPPAVTAAGATWQFNGEPVPFAGSLYYPTGPTVFFNGFVMVRIGIYKGVPIYTDATLEPNSVIYVPIGTNLMRPHERRRAGQLVGTVGSRAPSFPIERDVEVSARGSLESPAAAVEGRRERPTATTGSAVLADSRALTAATNRARTGSTTMRSIPPPRTNAGIWIEFNGARWRRAGAAVAFSAARFAPAGGYHGFPVYRDKTGQSDHIYIPAVSGGPLVPYSTR